MASLRAASPAPHADMSLLQRRQERQRQRSSSSTSNSSSSAAAASIRSASTLGPPSSVAASSIRSLSPIGQHRASVASPVGFFLPRRRSSSSGDTNAAAAARTRNVAFASAILSSLCAGSITVFSLYGHIFQSRLRYTQFEVNGVAIAGSVSSYLPVPLLGYLCDRLGPAPLSLASAASFGVGYTLAAAVFAHVDDAVRHGRAPHNGSPAAVPYALMVAAFVCIGVGTASMYLSAVATCAKNFGKGKHRGLALAVPIAAFGLSGMWQSQIGSRVLYERLPGGERGDLDVFRFFIFLAIVLVLVGIIGSFCLRIVDEDELIEEAVEELERSGLLSGAALFTPGGRRISAGGPAGGYGTMSVAERSNPFDDPAEAAAVGSDINSSSDDTAVVPTAGPLDPSHKSPDEEAATTAGEDAEAMMEARKKKEWVLNAETRRFLTDHTMWLFAAGFFFMVGPGEAFINNMGTVIKTLYPPATQGGGGGGLPTTAATHVSIVGVTSTIARLATGSLTDLLAPSPGVRHVQLSGSQILERPPSPSSDRRSWCCWPLSRSARRPSVSRVAFLIFSAALLSAGLATLASGAVQNHGERFWVVSGLVGAGYGAVFSLTPIIITVIWGVENFATNWGIVATMPALGATMWGLIYSAVYQAGASAAAGRDHDGAAGDGGGGGGSDIFCYGTECYASTFWAMSASVWVACVLVVLAWKGRNGWAQRGIVI